MRVLGRLFNYVNALLGINTLKSLLRFWGCMLVLLPYATLMIIFTYHELQNAKRESAENLQMTIALQQASIDKWFTERAAVIRDMANWPVLKGQEEDIEAINARIQQFLDSQDEFSTVIYVNKEGVTVADPIAAAGVDISDRRYYQEAAQGREYISDVLIGRGSAGGQPIIVFAAPILAEHQQVKGLMLGVVQLTTIDKVMNQFTFKHTGETYLVNQQGLMITESRFIEQMVKNGLAKDNTRMSFYINKETFDMIDQEQSGYAAYTNYRGKEVIGAYRRLLSRDWIIIGEIEEREILASFYRQISVMFLGFLVLMIATLPITMVLENRLATPIRRLIAGADAMRSGDYSYRVEQSLIDGSVSEIKTLCNVFNFMAENIRTKTEILNEANQALIVARDAALEASVAKSQFLANMSHEIRTPLNAILGMGELLAETSLTPEQEKYVRVFRTAGENLHHLINDILDLSKVELGHLSLNNNEFDLLVAVEETCEIMVLQAQQKGIALSWHIRQGTPVNVIGDSARLQQVLINLLANAVKFTEAGEVTVEIGQGCQQEGDFVELLFVVQDTGIGIPQDKLGHIFERFTQVDSSDTRKYGGTGLGLAIAKRLVELMGGRIWVESVLGVGSTFYFTIIVGRGSENREVVSACKPVSCREPMTEAIRQDPLHILLVEDSADNQLLIEAYLKKTPHTLDIAENGQIAVDKFIAGKYDLVFMDMQMPVMDGYQATRTIRSWEQKHALSRTPIIALTAYALQEDAVKTLESGCDAHLTKPIKKKVLLDAIAQYARRNLA